MGSECECPFDQIHDFEVRSISPTNGTIIYESEVTLVWSYIYTGPGYLVHYIYAGTSPGDPGYLGYHLRDEDTTYLLSSLEPATTYYWKIITEEDDDGTFTPISTETRFFTTYNRFLDPGGVHTPTPDSGAIGVSVNPSFAWEVYNPDLLPYDFDIYLGTTTDPPLLVSGLSAPWYNLLGDTLEDTTIYYWRVEAYYDADTVDGPIWQFLTDYPSDISLFALLEIDARQGPTGYHVMEEVRARFDTGTAIVAPIEPLQADSVFVEGFRMIWSAVDSSYSYTEWSMPFIENGQPVDFNVYGNSDVLDLNTSFVFPACTLNITDPESFETVSITGFEVSWDGSECGGMVWLTLMDGTDSTGIWKETANDGIDSLTAADLAPLGGQTGVYHLVIIKQVEGNIIAPGYRPESLIRARVYNVVEQINIFSK